MVKESESKYWLDQVVADVVEKYPTGEIILSSGITPSASYHIGHFPEILMVDVIAWALRQLGRKVQHIHVIDNFDPLRKRYDFLPEWLDEYVGQPICLVPAPDKSKQTYAQYFFKEFEQYFSQMGIKPDQIISSYDDLYKDGKMADCFEEVLSNTTKIRTIFKKVANRDLEKDWTPVQVLGDDNKFFNADEKTFDKEAKTIAGKSYVDGHAKLNWRLDWPGRWKVLGVMVEPFNAHEHGAAGSSYDTGKVFAKEIFGIEPPIPGLQYGNIMLIGNTKKMSSSLGNFITPKQALAMMPPEVLRYFILKSRPDKPQVFDPGLGIFRLWEEYKEVEAAVVNKQGHEFQRAYETANAHTKERVSSDVPFDHLVSVYQAAQGERKQVDELLGRSGYGDAAKNQQTIIAKELEYVKNWLKNYAPENVKFSLQKKLPKVELSDTQKQFLAELAGSLEAAGELEAQAMHEAIYAAKEEVGVEPKAAFQAIYRVLFNQDSGPKAGWFLASLDRAWLAKRLRQAA